MSDGVLPAPAALAGAPAPFSDPRLVGRVALLAAAALGYAVILPLAMPGVIAGTILSFILAMNAYATPVLLGGPTFQMMGPTVYGQFAGLSNWPFGAALSFVLMTATLLLTVTSNWVAHRRYRR